MLLCVAMYMYISDMVHVRGVIKWPPKGSDTNRLE